MYRVESPRPHAARRPPGSHRAALGLASSALRRSTSVPPHQRRFHKICSELIAVCLDEPNSMIDFPTEPHDPIGIFAARRFRRALRRMLEAKAYATRTTCSLWEYAVGLALLRQLGLTENDLRYLVRSQYLEHAWEVSAAGRDAREFRSAGRLAFDERSCFVLTPRGARLASGALGKARSLVSSGVKTRAASNAAPALPLPRRPAWDAERRILFWQGRIVKRFLRHAANQELVFQARFKRSPGRCGSTIHCLRNRART